MTFELLIDLTCIAPQHSGSSAGLGSNSRHARHESFTLASRLPRPHANLRTLNHSKFSVPQSPDKVSPGHELMTHRLRVCDHDHQTSTMVFWESRRFVKFNILLNEARGNSINP
ncbi:hypothetical protein TNCV_975901 [Trichonephila clavipes]|nr:hypothetical protein TNCV_975901 [Trichonephila clavipes]